MRQEILMPTLSDEVEEGVLVTWFVVPGASVRAASVSTRSATSAVWLAKDCVASPRATRPDSSRTKLFIVSAARAEA